MKFFMAKKTNPSVSYINLNNIKKNTCIFFLMVYLLYNRTNAEYIPLSMLIY